jgi:type I restriction enzyme S subunit
MITDLKPYSAMKDSGVEWLGDVPEHWEVRRVKSNVTNVVDQTSEREKDDAYIALEHVQSWTGQIIDAGSDVEFDSQVKRFRRNDVLFGKLRPYLAKVARPVVDGVCVGEFLVLRTDEQAQTSNFLEQVMRSKPVIDVINASTFGAKMPRADWNFIGSLPQALPPLPEQAAIVRYLDHVDRRVRRLVRAKRKLIALLTEQKQAIIHRAVTRGLDPNVPLKDSGVEWLGEVPEHWGISRAKQILQQVVPEIPPDAEMVTCFRDGEVTLRTNRRTEGFTNAIKELGYQGIYPGQLVLHSMDAFAGAIGVSDSKGKCSPEYVICEPAMSGVSLEYYGALLRALAIRGLFVWLCNSVRERAPRVRFSHFGSFSLPKPPLAEQESIMRYVRSAVEHVDTARERAQREIELLNEYRTRLISDVVTGKLDVRDAAAALPEVDPLAEDDDADELDADLALDAAELDETPEEVEA